MVRSIFRSGQRNEAATLADLGVIVAAVVSGQGRGAAPVEAKPKARSRRVATGGETRGRKLSMPDAVFGRLQLLAIQRRKTVSALATEILGVTPRNGQNCTLRADEGGWP